MSCLLQQQRHSVRIGSVGNDEKRSNDHFVLVLVVTITAFRLMIVVKPLYSQVYCSNRNERKALIIIFLFSILSITPYYYYNSRPNAQYVIKVISAILSLFIPWCICILLWILLLRIVNREIGVRNSKQFTLHSEIITQRLKSKSKITKMVLIICFSNIICQLPVLSLTIFGLINGSPCGYISAMFFVCVIFLSNLLLIINHSINFVIYSLTNHKFRYSLKVMYRHCMFPYSRRVSKQQAFLAIHYDEPRQQQQQLQVPCQQRFDCNSCSNSRSHESVRLVATKKTKQSLELNQNNLPRLLI